VPLDPTLKAKHSIGLLFWLLCREVLRLRQQIDTSRQWEVPVDLFFYRDPEELRLAQLRDPLLRAQAHYQALGGALGDLQALDAQAAAEVAEAMAQADAAPWPEASAAYSDIQSTGEGMWF
jgi:hypothetical protein